MDGGGKIFYEDHIKTIKEDLKVIEEDCVQAGIHRGKEVDFENTKRLITALIRYAASRSLKPHLHSHALLMKLRKNRVIKLGELWRRVWLRIKLCGAH